MLEYRLTLSEEHVAETLRRYRQQSEHRWWFLPLKGLCALGTLAFVALGILAKVYVLAAIFGFIALCLLAAPKFDLWLMRRRFRKSPYFGEMLVVTLSDKGYRAETSKSSSDLSWAVITKVRRYSDGVLLFHGSLFEWLPDSALIKGEIQDVPTLFANHVADCAAT